MTLKRVGRACLEYWDSWAGRGGRCGWRATSRAYRRAAKAHRAVSHAQSLGLCGTVHIREVVEMHTPSGSVLPGEFVEPPLTAEAEALVAGILAIVDAR